MRVGSSVNDVEDTIAGFSPVKAAGILGSEAEGILENYVFLCTLGAQRDAGLVTGLHAGARDGLKEEEALHCGTHDVTIEAHCELLDDDRNAKSQFDQMRRHDGADKSTA